MTEPVIGRVTRTGTYWTEDGPETGTVEFIPGAAGYVIGEIHYWPGDMPDYCPGCGGEDMHIGACDYLSSNGPN